MPIPPALLDEQEGPERILIAAQVAGYGHSRRRWLADLRQGGVSRTWEQFVSASQAGTEPILPDFSYAGYHYFRKRVPDAIHPVFDVTRYGAVPDDDRSDQAAIASAIAAAEANGSGIVFFPPGEFLVNTDADRDASGALTPIYIRGSRLSCAAAEADRAARSSARSTTCRQPATIYGHLPTCSTPGRPAHRPARWRGLRRTPGARHSGSKSTAVPG